MEISEYRKLEHNVQLLDGRLTLAGLRSGLAPCRTDYELVTDDQMIENIPYVMMPVHRRHWRYGKHAQQERQKAGTYHIFEAVINTEPSMCYLGTTNDLSMQLLVMAHAKWGHVDFFQNNRFFDETHPTTVIERFAQAKRFVDWVIEHSDFGYDWMEYYVDAAHALEQYVGWLPTVAQIPEKELREQYMAELRRLESEYTRAVTEADRKGIERDIKEQQARLKCHPLVPTADMLGFLMDPDNTHLPDEARRLIEIVRDEARYFQPQARTKFMNEGWASYWERALLLEPELSLPFDMRFDLSRYWTMHDRQAVSWYFDPYALGLGVWNYIDEKYGFNEGEVRVKTKPLTLGEDGLLVEAAKAKTVTVTQRNRDKMMEVRRTYDDTRFIDEFLNEELFEKINLKSLEWLRRLMNQINRLLRKSGWGANVIFDPVPDDLEGMANVIETWHNLAEQTQWWHQNLGVPTFPLPVDVLHQMSTIIQIIGAFDQDKHKARRQIVLRTGYNSVPNIRLVDTGRYTDNIWTLRHEYDPQFGPLLQSEARLTLRFFRRLCGAPVRLLTMEQRTDIRGRPYGDPVPFEYFTEDGDTVKESYL